MGAAKIRECCAWGGGGGRGRIGGGGGRGRIGGGGGGLGALTKEERLHGSTRGPPFFSSLH